MSAFTLTAHPDRPRAGQRSLFGPSDVSPDKLATALARLFAILGEDRVGSPRTVDGQLPERFELVPYTPPSPPRERQEIRPGKGPLAARVFRPPLPLEVLTAGEEAPTAPTSETPAPCTAPPDFIRTVPSEEKKPQIEGHCQGCQWTPSLTTLGDG